MKLRVRTPFDCLIIGFIVAGCIGMAQVLIEIILDRSMNVFLAVLVQLTVMLLVANWLLSRLRKELLATRHQPPFTVTPGMIDHDTELGRHVIAQSWNTGKPTRGWVDDNGKMHFEEVPEIRVPVTRTDADGTVVDGTAAVTIVGAPLDGGMAVRGRVHDVRDLDGNEMDLPPGSKLEGGIG